MKHRKPFPDIPSPSIHTSGSTRSGTASVELAILTPFLLVLTLGTMDVCSMIFLKESATLAAYEGARRGIEKGGTNEDAEQTIINFLNERQISHTPGQCTSFSNPGFDTAETLEHITVTVTLPIEGNLLIAPHVIQDVELTASVTMRKEYENEN